MRIRLALIAVAAVLLAVGCDEVEERLAWSPDGARAVLRVGDKVFLMDPSGKLSAPVASNVVSAAWLPDSRGLVLHRSLAVTDWAEAVRLLPREEIDAAQSLAKGFPDLLRVGLALANGEATNLYYTFFGQLKMEHPELLSPTILCAFDTQAAALDRAIQTAKEPDKLKENLSNARTTTVNEVSVLLLAGEPLRVIERTLTGLEQPRPSPSGTAVAFLRDDTLTVAALDGSTNRVDVAANVEGNYDWTADGKSLVYAVRLTEKDSSDINLSRIEQRVVVDASGALIAGDAQPLALNATTFKPRVRSLAGGRVLFAGAALHLPAREASPACFYLIDPSRGTNTVAEPIPSAPGSLPQELAYFVPSGDGSQIALAESGSDSVAVLDVATGSLEVVSPKRGWKSRILPAWRGTDELYFAALPEASTNRPELFRWRKGSAPQVVSGSWGDEAVGGLLQKPSK